MTDNLKSPSQDHWAALAATRFLLSLIVLFGHLGGIGVGGEFTKGMTNYGELAAVVGFFIISGFSIGNSISQRPKRYIIRRIWRIWPTYLFSFFCCTLPAAWVLGRHHFEYFGGQKITAAMIAGNLFMLQGIVVQTMETNAATWTLAMEEWYYLFAPVFRRFASWLLVSLIAVSAFFYMDARSIGWIRFAGKTHGISHLCFLWAWLIGFWFYRHRHSIWAQLALFLLPVWLFCESNELGGDRAVFTLLAATLVVAYGGVMFAFAKNLPEVLVEMEYRRGKVALIKWRHVRQFLVFLGNVSYPLYIIHLPIEYVIKLTGCLSLPVYVAAIFAASILVYYFIDKPNRGRWQTKEQREEEAVRRAAVAGVPEGAASA